MIEENPDEYALQFGLANILNNKGNYDEAIYYYKKVNH